MHITTVSESTPDYARKSEGDVVELKDGRLLLVYMEFGSEGDDFDRTQLAAKESTDGGLTWGQHRVLTGTAPEDVNVYSPNLIRSQDGGILLIFMRRHSVLPFDNTFHAWKSDDEGATFRPHAVFVERAAYNLCNAVVKRLSSGRLLLPTASPVEGAAPPEYSFTIAILLSDDDGLTWREADQRIHLPMRGAMEPHVEETRDGRVLMVMRNQLGSLFLSASITEGTSWSLPQTTGLRTPESCPELTRIPSTGDLLMIWNNTEYNPSFRSHYGPRNPLTAALSQDEGKTWRLLRDIENDERRAYSNPGCRFTSTGTAILNYWTCEYREDSRLQDKIDLRVAAIPTEWFYGN
ncbi:sialidase family protein [Paenibacillus eucommiae]|uniref:Sialidase-1 n=1 Tax=Paenibacillus eucommiae TaxID=1355755 RepID=A0ABS4ITT4_9BACL|nr:sialidase family protein [Paenibacillus eucommiae]MBP1990436.1 sialidase-1 [Paenibacillus eucommiae]